jgi:polyhydroxyalkanoate synthesis regulator phasin
MTTTTTRKRGRTSSAPHSRSRNRKQTHRRATHGRVAQDPVRELWLAGLGVAASTGETAGRVIDTLVERGRREEPKLKAEAKRMVAETRAKAEELGSAVGRSAKRMLDEASRRLGVEDRRRPKNLLHRLGDLAEAIL